MQTMKPNECSAGEISAPLWRRHSEETTGQDRDLSIRIPVFVANYAPSSKRGKMAGSSRSKRGSIGTSHLETLASRHLVAAQIDGYRRDFKFHTERNWKFDFAWPEQKTALEIEGGIWMPKGAHSGGAAITRDIEKYNSAQLLGWVVIRATKAHMDDGSMIRWVKQALGVE